MATFTKDPESVLDYGWTWASWLASGETISTVTWTVPSGLTLDIQSESGGIVIVWISGGVVGTEYTIRCKIVTNQGRKDKRTFYIKVAER